MSSILKALRRLEEQKSAATPRPLRDEVVLTPTRRRGRSGLVVALVAVIAFALLATSLLWVQGRKLIEANQQAEAIAQAADVAAAPELALIAELAEERRTEVTLSASGQITGVTTVPVVPVPAPPPDFAVVRPRAQAPAAPVATRDDEPSDEAYEESVVAEPLPDALPGPVDDAVPTARVARVHAPVRVERTQWHPSPERRVAWVEVDGMTALREVREGERIGPYRVRAIEPAAVSFVDGSVEFRREVGQ